MKATFFLTVAAVFVAVVSATCDHGDNHSSDIVQEINGVGNEGRTSGVLNNAIQGGILADNSQSTHIVQDAH
ncbi:uncharacterized protein BYT42DRAFT_649219 [Radiomyces spectabilis]|uniref:uncharacterized protein n=1 Tax=Radiomyces spectabilis TaxID=64574 RepID=UPI00221FFD5C|nr:uncharacterized protein BYT42DRAFT_649219 [Radiomyces spectabilis]KAI8365304.1 hypothetical protein BYT42DRAFT_649219 [Radiomyces spectabilis]